VSLQVHVSAHTEEHSQALLLRGSECVCAYLAVRVCMLGGKWVKQEGLDYSQRAFPLPFLFLLCSHSC